MKPLNGRLAELPKLDGAEIVYAGWAWAAPNRWISPAIVNDFLERGLVEKQGKRAVITQKGVALLAQKESK